MSNRLGASLPRARFLGMIVGSGVSRLVDAPDKAMKFDMEEMESDDARRFLDLVNIADKIGDLEDLKRHTTMTKPASTRSSKIPKQEMRQAPKKGFSNYASKIISIEEVEDGVPCGFLIKVLKGSKGHISAAALHSSKLVILRSDRERILRQMILSNLLLNLRMKK